VGCEFRGGGLSSRGAGPRLVSYLFTRFFGSGTLHVVTVGSGGVNLSVDGTPTLESLQDEDHYTFKISQGQHEVKITDPGTGTSTTYSVNVPDGFTDVLLPVRADQCFVRFNMTTAAYSSGNSDQPPPVVDRFKNGGQPITVPSSTYFTFEEMPKKRRDKQSVYMLRDVPCALLGPNVNEDLLLVALSSKADELFTDLDAIVKTQE
jgi:hypothetical protein